MRKAYFYDTSGLIKLYHQEIGTEWVEEIFGESRHTIIISELSTVEFYSALAKKLRMREITKEATEEALKNFQKDCQERFLISPLDRATVKKAQELIRKYGETHALRTLDALQLAACLLEMEEGGEFVCADGTLIKVAQLEGIRTVNPEVEDDSAERHRVIEGSEEIERHGDKEKN